MALPLVTPGNYSVLDASVPVGPAGSRLPTYLEIHGFGFSTNPANDQVTFCNGVTGTVISASDTTLVVEKLSGLELGPLSASVTVNGFSSGAPVMVGTVIPYVVPNLDLLPANPRVWVIQGNGFSSLPADDVVTLDGQRATVLSATATTLTVSLSGVDYTEENLWATVTVDSLTSWSEPVASLDPVVHKSTARLGPDTSTIIIDGSGFNKHDGVTFSGGVKGTVTGATFNQLTVTFAPGEFPVGPLLATVWTSIGMAVEKVPPDVMLPFSFWMDNSGPVQVATIGPVEIPVAAAIPATPTASTIDGPGIATNSASDMVTLSDAVKGKVTGASVSPVVTPNLADVASSAASLVIQGFGFSPNMALDTVTFSNGATGTIAYATATTLTVTDLYGLTIGALRATVFVDSVSSTEEQVATVT
jgi:hypothetical protein